MGLKLQRALAFSSVFVHVQKLGSAPLMTAAPKYISILAHTYNTVTFFYGLVKIFYGSVNLFMGW